MITIIIPSRNEIFLKKTIEDLLEKSRGDIEIIAVLDGYWPLTEEIVNDKRVKYLHRGRARGMRNGINSAVAISNGEYIMKIDAHCMVDEGFDLKLLADMKDDWVVVPRRKRLDAENWCIQDVGKPDVDYEFVTNPKTDDMHGKIWTQRALERKDILIDDCPTFQGSCWFMKKDYFNDLELMDEKTYGMFFNEAQEISFKAWLSGGRVMVNKKTWYAHLHKGSKYGRGYSIGGEQRPIASKAMRAWVKNNAWDKQTIDFSSLVEYFKFPEWTEEDLKEIKKYDKFGKKIQEHIQDPATREELAEYFARLGLKKGAEIGVERGVYTEVLCQAGLKAYAVDAWTAYKGYRDHVSQSKLDKFYENTKKRLAKYDCEVIKGFSMDIVKKFENESLDWVYIDGNHEFQNVTNDIAEWSKKVKKGGIVAGHDFKRFGGKYGLNSCHVKDVVLAWCKAHNIELKTTNEGNPSWWYVKK